MNRSAGTFSQRTIATIRPHEGEQFLAVTPDDNS
jgi:hypothetical protein